MGCGFLPLALVFFSMWNPCILLAGASLFGIMWQLSLSPELILPGVLSRYVWGTGPFAITIPILCIISTPWFRPRWGLAKPQALGRPYARGCGELAAGFPLPYSAPGSFPRRA